MGNYVSCTLSTQIGGKPSNSSTTTVVFPSGEVRRFQEPVKAAELMFEMPNFFVVNSQSVHVGRRFSALMADEDLEMGNSYVLFPMKKVNSVVSVADMGALFLAAERVSGGKKRRIVGGGKTEESEAKLKLDNEEGEEFSPEPVMSHRRSMCRSRKPLLETIVEEPMCSR
ncbi:uncharacterized protein LOC111808736 [Cucurbita pepo subsp. pepo]|uniref:uncharacterized protein LOC111808736 n=1 Tax=Cucurbita pepo subsp. pepo TaxID=3664 RepID=UPI000C9D98F3|nr:uncharacterized protein LOC111808736 [Cucurbita pepo subsp. pepo]